MHEASSFQNNASSFFFFFLLGVTEYSQKLSLDALMCMRFVVHRIVIDQQRSCNASISFSYFCCMHAQPHSCRTRRVHRFRQLRRSTGRDPSTRNDCGRVTRTGSWHSAAACCGHVPTHGFVQVSTRRPQNHSRVHQQRYTGVSRCVIVCATL